MDITNPNGVPVPVAGATPTEPPVNVDGLAAAPGQPLDTAGHVDKALGGSPGGLEDAISQPPTEQPEATKNIGDVAASDEVADPTAVQVLTDTPVGAPVADASPLGATADGASQLPSPPTEQLPPPPGVAETNAPAPDLAPPVESNTLPPPPAGLGDMPPAPVIDATATEPPPAGQIVPPMMPTPDAPPVSAMPEPPVTPPVDAAPVAPSMSAMFGQENTQPPEQMAPESSETAEEAAIIDQMDALWRQKEASSMQDYENDRKLEELWKQYKLIHAKKNNPEAGPSQGA